MNGLSKLWNKRMWQGALFAGILFFLAGCASAPRPSQHFATDADFKFDLSAPLGFVENSGADPDKYGVAECGLAKKVSRKVDLTEVNIAMHNVVFPAAAGKLMWFAHFNMKGISQQQIPRGFVIRWFSPDGKLFYEKEFKSSFWMEDLVRTTLEFPKPFPDPLIGRWRVRVWCQGGLLDDRYFEIVKTEN